MKLYVLVGAVALFILVLAVLPAAAVTDKVNAFGTVVDALGRPVAGANVTLIDDNYVNGNFQMLASTTTDENGNFLFMNEPLKGSTYLKVTISFVSGGKTYTSSLSDMQWTDASQGIVNFNKNYTVLSQYPESDHGYAWGVVLSAAANGKALDGTVYLVNDTTTLTGPADSSGAYSIVATPGDYEIYAVHNAGTIWLVSNKTKITVTPSYHQELSSPQVLVADVETSSPAMPTPSPSSGTITAYGTVTDARGDPVEGANVTVIDDRFHALGTVSTDSYGNFKFMNLRLAGSTYLKVTVSYLHVGQYYNTSTENLRWYDASSGVLNFDPAETCLYNYPSGDHGYVWGVVMDNLTNGRALDSTVYLRNDTTLLSTTTSSASGGSFQLEVSPGDYVIYAVHGEGINRTASKHVSIHVYASNDLLQSAPIDLIVDRDDASRPVALLPMALALIIGIGLMVAGREILVRWR